MKARVVAVNSHPEVTFDYEQEALAQLGVRIERVAAANDADLVGAAADADVVIGRVTAGAIAGLARCRHIPSGGIGVDHIDVVAATKAGIVVTNMADTFVEEVANHAWMLLLMTARRGVWLHEMATTGRWREALDQLFPVQRLPMPRVTGQTLGLVSLGRIARGVARRGKAFGMAVIAHDPYVSDEVFAEHGVERVGIEELFRRGDFVSCHLPWTPETLHLIGEQHFALMRPTAIFLNTGRGKVVDEAALIGALQQKRLAGAGLDVLEQEPPDPANPLLHMANVTVSPHMASVSDVSSIERRRLLGRQVAATLRGEVPVGVVNPEVLERWRGRAHAAV